MELLDEINYFYYKMSLWELKTLSRSEQMAGLSYNSMLYLNVIYQMEECTVSKIAEALSLTKSAVTIKIAELLRQGVVCKKQSQADKRVFYITISPEHRKIITQYDAVFLKIQDSLSGKYSKEEMATFAKILRDISNLGWSITS